MNTAIIYHWWGYNSDAPPIANLRSPIVASISTLRGVNPDVPIYVIDVSDNEQNWKDLPNLLGFNLIQQEPYLKNQYKQKEGYRNLSRLFDINRLDIPEEEIVYVDSDVFFLKDPLPLQQDTDKFCFNSYNSGFYYYNKNSQIVQNFMDIFEAYVVTALNDENFRCITKQFGNCDDYFVLDETMMHYMYIKHRNLFNIVTPIEHFTVSEFDKRTEEIYLYDVRMFHANGTMVNNKYAKHEFEKQHSRGLICLGIKELYTNMQFSLGSVNLNKMFTQQEQSAFMSKQSIFNEDLMNKLVASKKPTGHYFFSEAINVV